jgi:hypothetical protein
LRPDLKQNITAPHWPRPLAGTLHTKEMPPKKKVRRYPQICLVKVDNSRHYGDGVGNEMYQLQLVVVQKTPEEVTRGEVQECSK